MKIWKNTTLKSRILMPNWRNFSLQPLLLQIVQNSKSILKIGQSNHLSVYLGLIVAVVYEKNMFPYIIDREAFAQIYIISWLQNGRKTIIYSAFVHELTCII